MIKEKNEVTFISFGSFLEQKMDVETTAILFVLESEVEINYLIGIIKKAISIGTMYFLAWGQGPDKLHDLFDDVIISEQIDKHGFDYDSTLDKTILTIGNSDYTVEEAVDYFFLCLEREELNCRLLILFDTEGQHMKAIKEQLDVKSR